MILRIEEAIARAKRKGIEVKKKDVAARLWPDSEESAQQVSFTKLIKGKTLAVRPEWVIAICEMCDCTPNYLFGIGE